MMKTWIPALLLVPAIALFALSPLADTPQIIVINADRTWTSGLNPSAGLVQNASAVLPRVAVEYANAVKHHALSVIPSALRTLMESVSARIVFEYANSAEHHDLTALPSVLQDLVGQVPARIVAEYANALDHHDLIPLPSGLQNRVAGVVERITIEYANANQHAQLAYPRDLMGDIQPPAISNVTAISVTAGAATITWATDELADSIVVYGRQAGMHPAMVADPLYTKDHQLLLTRLAPDTTYFYKVRSTDRSGNASESSEDSFTTLPGSHTHLPLILRNRR